MSPILTGLLLLEVTSANPAVPPENVEKPKLETLATYDPSPLIKQLNAPETEEVWNPLFFPKDAFDLVKGIKDPGAYHKQLLKWFADDIKRESARLKAKGPWEVDSFKMGYCKWKVKGSEANALPYWSCYKNKVSLKNKTGDRETVEIRVLINWGKDWFVTHLGPIPKS